MARRFRGFRSSMFARMLYSGWMPMSSSARFCSVQERLYPTWTCAQRISVSPVCRNCVRVHHILPSLLLTFLVCTLLSSLFNHACRSPMADQWLYTDSEWSLRWITLGDLPSLVFQHLMSPVRHSLLTCRQQHDSPGTSHLWRLQHRPCPSMLLHRCGTHTVRDMMLTHRLTTCRWMPLLSLCRRVPLLKMLPLSFSRSVFPRRRICSERRSRATDPCHSADGSTPVLAGTAERAPSDVLFSFYGPAWTSVTSWPG